MRLHGGGKGFTLIEVAVALAIVGILAAIAIPAYTSSMNKARMAEMIYAMGAVKDAVIAYYAESGAVVDAPDAVAIKSVYHVDLSTGSAGFSYRSADNTITAASTVPGVPGTVALYGTQDYKVWTWGGTVDGKYLPRN